MRFHEAHVEHLLGRRVRDVQGELVGRIEEMLVDVVDGDHVVMEFHVGPAALEERIAGFAHNLPFLALLPRAPRGYRVRWNDMDLSDPLHPRVRVRRAELPRGVAG